MAQQLTKEQQQVLDALGISVWNTVKSLARKTGLPRNKVSTALRALKAKKLAGKFCTFGKEHEWGATTPSAKRQRRIDTLTDRIRDRRAEAAAEEIRRLGMQAKVSYGEIKLDVESIERLLTLAKRAA